jgi:hypothetical protein
MKFLPWPFCPAVNRPDPKRGTETWLWDHNPHFIRAYKHDNVCKFLDSINCFRLQLAVGKGTTQSSAGHSGKVIKGKDTCLMCSVKVKKKRLEHHMTEKCPSKILWNRLDASTRAKLLAGVEESCQPKQAGLEKTRFFLEKNQTSWLFFCFLFFWVF